MRTTVMKFCRGQQKTEVYGGREIMRKIVKNLLYNRQLKKKKKKNKKNKKNKNKNKNKNKTKKNKKNKKNKNKNSSELLIVYAL